MCNECGGVSRIFGAETSMRGFVREDDGPDMGPFVTPDQAAAILVMPDQPGDPPLTSDEPQQGAPDQAAIPDNSAPQILYVQWLAYATACESCLANAAVGAVPVGTVFPSGDTAPPAHLRCQCELTPPSPLMP